MARKNKRFEVHQSLGVFGETDPRNHECTPIPCRNPRHICLGCGRVVQVTT